MKTFLIALVILIIAISAAVFGFKYWQQQSQKGQGPVTLQNTLTGVLQAVPSTGEYSDIIVSGDKTVGVTSNTVNLKPYENKKVKVVGEYSGNTMYADSVTLIP